MKIPKNRITNPNIKILKENEIFIFGSNKDGKHTSGAAKTAKQKFGAIEGQGKGLQGQSYAINTMSGLPTIKLEVSEFIRYAKNNNNKTFLVTEIACGIAGHTPEEIAPLFLDAIYQENIVLPQSFWNILDNINVLGIKGTDKNMKCRDHQFEIGKKYTHTGEIEPCKSGYHFCQSSSNNGNLLDVFNYYPPLEGNRYFRVSGEGTIKTHNDDSKVAVSDLTIESEISLSDLVNDTVKNILDNIIPSATPTSNNTGDCSAATNTGFQSAATNTGNKSAATNTGFQSAATNTGNKSAATNTGDYSAATNTGDYSAATNTGNKSAATNTGNKSAATNTGDYSAATNTGDYSAATNTGNKSAATNTGIQSAATNTGNKSAATNTGNKSAATNTGNKSAATNTGDYSAATNTGDYSAATNTGDYSVAIVEGLESVASALGIDGKAKGIKGCWLTIAEWVESKKDNKWHRIDVQTKMVDGKNIKENTFYKLKNGKFVKCE